MKRFLLDSRGVNFHDLHHRKWSSIVVSQIMSFTFPYFSRIDHPFVFLAGPLLYLYIRTLTL